MPLGKGRVIKACGRFGLAPRAPGASPLHFRSLKLDRQRLLQAQSAMGCCRIYCEFFWRVRVGVCLAQADNMPTASKQEAKSKVSDAQKATSAATRLSAGAMARLAAQAAIPLHPVESGESSERNVSRSKHRSDDGAQPTTPDLRAQPPPQGDSVAGACAGQKKRVSPTEDRKLRRGHPTTPSRWIWSRSGGSSWHR